MTMSPKKLRLSPSGPFLRDSVGDAPLQTGPGSPGLMWRAQGTTGAQVQDATAGVNPTGLSSLGWDLPGGYHYDFEAGIYLRGTNSGPVVAHIQVHDAVTGAWSNVEHGGDITFQLVAAAAPNNGGCIIVSNVDVDRTAANAIDDVRLFVQTGNNVDGEHCWLRATQYVL